MYKTDAKRVPVSQSDVAKQIEAAHVAVRRAAVDVHYLSRWLARQDRKAMP